MSPQPPSSPGLSPASLEEFNRGAGVRAELLTLDDPTPTVETAARAVHAPADAIVKSLLFLVEQAGGQPQPVLAVLCGSARVDRRAIAGEFGVSRKRVRLAAADEVAAISGYEVGAMPPFGHRQPLATLVDSAVLEQPVVYAGGGSEHTLMRLAPDEILRVSGAKVIRLRE
jgi:prolyl-tRNA editing enzyme YbaK/EbsC (Cys-tRNA(Pro) deacylase)